MPTLLTTLFPAPPLRLKPPGTRRRRTDPWHWVWFLTGVCIGWIIHHHLG